MSTKLFTLAVVALILAACGTEPETAVAFYPVELSEGDFQPTQVATYTVTALCQGETETTMRCYTDKAELVGLLTRATPVLADEPTPVVAPQGPPEHLEDQFIEIACRLCARYQGQARDACMVCESDDEPELHRPEI